MSALRLAHDTLTDDQAERAVAEVLAEIRREALSRLRGRSAAELRLVGSNRAGLVELSMLTVLPLAAFVALADWPVEPDRCGRHPADELAPRRPL